MNSGHADDEARHRVRALRIGAVAGAAVAVLCFSVAGVLLRHGETPGDILGFFLPLSVGLLAAALAAGSVAELPSAHAEVHREETVRGTLARRATYWRFIAVVGVLVSLIGLAAGDGWWRLGIAAPLSICAAIWSDANRGTGPVSR